MVSNPLTHSAALRRKYVRTGDDERALTGRPAPSTRIDEFDFVHDSLDSGRRIRTLNIVDDYTRECLAIELDTSLSDGPLARIRDAIGAARGFPQTNVMDNGTELTGIAMACWAGDRRVRLHFIDPGKPTQNTHI